MMTNFCSLLPARRLAILLALGLGGAFARPAQAQATFGTATTYSTNANSYPHDVALVDVNRDGKVDILTPLSGTVGVQLGTGTGTFGTIATYASGMSSMNSDRIMVTDVSGDGKPDAIMAPYKYGSTAGVSVLLGTGNTTGTFGTASVYSAGASTSTTNGISSLAVGDVNGDGRPDIVTANNGGDAGRVAVLLGTGGGSFGGGRGGQQGQVGGGQQQQGGQRAAEPWGQPAGGGSNGSSSSGDVWNTPGGTYNDETPF